VDATTSWYLPFAIPVKVYSDREVMERRKQINLKSLKSPVLLSLVSFLILFSNLLNFTGNFASAESRHVRVINGVEAPDAYPWMVSLGSSNAETAGDAHFCGATLIAPDLALTAAHCVEEVLSSPSDVSVVVGARQLSTFTGDRLQVKGFVIHPFYKFSTSEFDVAIVKLTTPASNMSVFPLLASLADEESYINTATKVSIMGWGLKDPDFPVRPDFLQLANIPIQTPQECSSRLGLDYHSESMLCAGVLASSQISGDGIDTCQGDSGGPLIDLTEGDRPKLVGITSWGYACGSPRLYGVYSKISAVRDWILSNPKIIPFNMEAPLVSGVPAVGRKLTCDLGKWGGEENEIKLTVNWTDVESGEIVRRGKTIELGRRDVGRKLLCNVEAADDSGAVASSEPIGPVYPKLKSPVRSSKKSSATLKSIGRVCSVSKCAYLIEASHDTLSLKILGCQVGKKDSSISREFSCEAADSGWKSAKKISNTSWQVSYSRSSKSFYIAAQRKSQRSVVSVTF